MVKRKIMMVNRAAKTYFEARLEELLNGLYFISETDSEIRPFVGGKAKSVAKEILLAEIGKSGNEPVEEKSFEDFFAPLTEFQDWYGEEEKQAAQRFSELKKILQEELSDLTVFKVGTIELDIYVVGLDKKSVLRGIKTQAVET